ncbi:MULTISPECIES: alpha/beta hydrolase [unclassified Mycobacterium]|uniref:alpha/beta hydrolase n=1 Tax=unclassified Mycobacterium TaxID=2642494 RepID=UPI0029C82CB5|nr:MULTISPECIES: alpha/beta hydrolase [unclassified Mycobacterium]
MAVLWMAVVMVAIGAAALTGAANATAEPASETGSAGSTSSESSASTPKSPAVADEPKTTKTGATSTESKTDGAGSSDATKPTEHDSTPADSPSDVDTGGVKPTAEPTAEPSSEPTVPAETDAETDAEPTTGHESKATKPHTEDHNSTKPETESAAKPAATTPSDTSTAHSEESEQAAASSTAAVSSESRVAAETDSTAAASQPESGAATEAAAAVAVRSTVTLDEEVAAPRAPTLVDVVGSIVLNLVMGLIQVFDGPPVLPAGSTVTVRTSTLTIPVAGGRSVEADWYFPTDAEPTRLIYLQHGLGASAPMYSYTAATLAEQTHSIVVAPSITSNFFDADGAWLGGTPMQRAVAELFTGDRAALTESASAAAGYDVTLPTSFVLAGHSLGGTLVSGAAGYMVENGAITDLAGVLLLDAVDLNGAVPSALEKLTGVNYRPVLNISSERYFWNMNGKVSDELEAARPGLFNGVMLVGGRHIDALQGGNPLIQFSEYLIAGFSQPQNIEAVRTLAVGWVNDMFAGTDDGIYGAPGETIQIDTSTGTATAVALPFPSAQVSLIGYVLNGLLDFAARNFFVYEPLAGQPTAV